MLPSMFSNKRTALGIGLLLGLLLAGAVALWWRGGPSEATVRRTVLTTIQDEAPASFLVTGTLELNVTVHVDSSQLLTPSWLTILLGNAQPGFLALVQGGAETRVQVPGTVSYGFDVHALTPSMVTVGDDGLVGVELPSLSVYSVGPNLAELKVRTQATGWMRVLPSDTPDEVRAQALSAVQEAFRTQAERHLDSATQPRVNTARALEAMLRPALRAAGVSSPRFRIRIGEDLVMQPEG